MFFSSNGRNKNSTPKWEPIVIDISKVIAIPNQISFYVSVVTVIASIES